MFENIHDMQLLVAQIFLGIAGIAAGIRVVDDVNFWRNRKMEGGR